ncbi:MAG TPA: pyrroline-5-carboxylate reductase [Aquella sp.]|nr:pyrroline-5-carboxylate reductase [Aquella sp.]
MKVIFIGGGNMAEAIFSRLNNDDVIVIQHNLQKLEKLKTKYPQINFLQKLDFTTSPDDLIILSIKPYDTKDACMDILQYTKNSTIISIVSGISCQALSRWLDNSRICRTMPNTPSQIGLGATAIYFTPAIADKQEHILNIFKKLGKVYQFDDEDKINQMTAMAGSGPAYVFYFIEALIKSAVNQFGLSPELAKEITLQVVKGGLGMIENNSSMTIEQLRGNVTSKKGTTEQAIKVLETYNFNNIIAQAELACYNRAKELSAAYKL